MLREPEDERRLKALEDRRQAILRDLEEYKARKAAGKVPPAKRYTTERMPEPVSTFYVAEDRRSALRALFDRAPALHEYVIWLEHELVEARALLTELWKSEPVPPREKRPYKGDAGLKCRKCGRPTFWRVSHGVAEHYPECPVKKTSRVPDQVWRILMDEEVD